MGGPEGAPAPGGPGDEQLVSLEAQEAWFVAHLTGPEGEAVLRRMVARHGVPDRLVDDVRQDWYLAVKGTLQGHADRPGRPAVEGMATVRQARPYVARALERRIIDLFRGRGAGKDLVRLGGDDVDPDAVLERLLGDESTDDLADGVVDALRSLPSDLRRRLNDRYFSGLLRCPRVSAPVFFGVALDLVAQAGWDGAPPGSAATDGLSGGTTESDRALYAAIGRARPAGVRVVDGRVTAADRQYKRRCRACLADLLSGDDPTGDHPAGDGRTDHGTTDHVPAGDGP